MRPVPLLYRIKRKVVSVLTNLVLKKYWTRLKMIFLKKIDPWGKNLMITPTVYLININLKMESTNKWMRWWLLPTQLLIF